MTDQLIGSVQRWEGAGKRQTLETSPARQRAQASATLPGRDRTCRVKLCVFSFLYTSSEKIEGSWHFIHPFQND